MENGKGKGPLEDGLLTRGDGKVHFQVAGDAKTQEVVLLLTGFAATLASCSEQV